MNSSRPKLELNTILEKGDDYFLSHLSIDCVIFGFHNNQLKVLLLEWKETKEWCLPGGFIFKDEPLEEAASRILTDRTGLTKVHLQQYHTFGDPDRARRKIAAAENRRKNKNSWVSQRFVSIGYWALVEFSKAVPTADELSSDVRWWNIEEVPQLVLDHNNILSGALHSLRRNLKEYPIGKELLPAKFTMPDLQNLYETSWERNSTEGIFKRKYWRSAFLKD